MLQKYRQTEATLVLMDRKRAHLMKVAISKVAGIHADELRDLCNLLMKQVAPDKQDIKIELRVAEQKVLAKRYGNAHIDIGAMAHALIDWR